MFGGDGKEINIDTLNWESFWRGHTTLFDVVEEKKREERLKTILENS